ncbi:26S proteasome non-ATPase regulatory subunit 4-like [Sorex fumeus]|uniref:26S proteasome non-ATPase regulatory subunit 4-like n=1 Tax=Sorex fumeus TaxID=62283 RepID=UPI0024AD5BB7|nr:26S proteasome non-ATPase regulatory subunit 4-like [Sorex fumeus]
MVPEFCQKHSCPPPRSLAPASAGPNHKMRIVIAFVGNPDAAKKDLVKLVKRLKKEKVNVDIINLGTQEVSTEKLTTFLKTLNGSGGKGSHLLTVPLGPNLAETIIGSQILTRKGRAASASGTKEFPFGVDLTGLALTLRVSMEEQRQWQKTGAKETPPATKATVVARKKENSEDALLKKTINEQEFGRFGFPIAGSRSKERQKAYGSQMSPEDAELGQGTSTATATQGTSKSAMEEEDYDVLQDAEFLQSVLENLPGVDPQSEAIRNATGSLTLGDSLSTKKDNK